MVRDAGNHICIHTHFNSEKEISWVRRRATRRLYAAGVIGRNQAVLLNNFNNDPQAMLELLHALADMNIVPVYIFQGDMVVGADDMRILVLDSLMLEEAVRDNIFGFLVPSFVVDLPVEVGERLIRNIFDYDRKIGS